MALEDVKLPDIGDYDEVDVIEVHVSAGDSIEAEDGMITLETDKASMEIPAPKAGKVKEVTVSVGDKVSQGDVILKLETEAGASDDGADDGSQQQKAESGSDGEKDSAPASSGSAKEVTVPDIGDYDEVDVIEVHVSEGDTIEAEDGLITLETDKASMEIPAPEGGTVGSLKVKVGDKVSQGDVILTLAGAGGASSDAKPDQASGGSQASSQESSSSSSGGASKEVTVPDIGDYDEVDVIEVHVNAGDTVEAEDGLITLETDKASMEIPAPEGGKIEAIKVKVGDKVSQGDVILTLAGAGGSQGSSSSDSKSAAPSPSPAPAPAPTPSPAASSSSSSEPTNDSHASEKVHAGPAVRRLARVLGVDLHKVKPTGRKGRITKEDCEAYVKSALSQVQSGAAQSGGGDSGLGLLPDPKVDFEKYGEIEVQPLTKINKLSAKNLHRNWVKIPHVTFYDDADITEMEAFRQANKAAAEKAGVKVSPLAFLVKAAASVLQEFPRLNSSLSEDGENLIHKKYFHIGFAADTPKGLIVPVIRDADKKGIYDISREMADLVKRGREGKVKPDEMKGATFTISSLGILGTTGFTPIINMPEVAILGVSKTAVKPVYNGKEFVPRSMLPLSLSVDHRVIDGALAAKFLTRVSQVLADLREILL